jgi:hypothetical protein
LWFEASPGKRDRETLARKNPSQKRAGGVAQGVGPEFKNPSTVKKKKEKMGTEVHACNPISFPGGNGRGMEFRPAWATS